MTSESAGSKLPVRILAETLDQLRESVMVTTGDLDPPGPEIVYVSQACARITGYSPEELLGQTPRILQGPETDRRVIDRLRRQLEAGEDFTGETVNYRKDGTPFWMYWYVTRLEVDGRASDYFIAVQRDVTEARRADEARRVLEVAIEQSSDSVLIFGRDGRVTYCNPAYRAWSGRSPDDVVGRAIWTLPGSPETRNDLLWARRLLSKSKPWQREVEVQRRSAEVEGDDPVRFAFVTVSPVLDEGRQPVEYLAIGRDVTERRRLESIAEAHNLHDNLGFVFSGLRHELGNPVNSLKAALRLVTDSLDTMPQDKLRQYLEGMSIEVGRVEYLLRSLRSYNLFQEPQLERVQVHSFLGRFRRLVEGELEERGIHLAVEIGRGLDRVHADPQALHQVLLNLVGNARQALEGRHDGRIDLWAAAAGRRVRLVVRDNGPGIPRHQLELAFKPFHTTRPRGTGLGLPICRRLVALMGGTLELKSTGRGTQAVILLERDAADEGAAEDSRLPS